MEDSKITAIGRDPYSSIALIKKNKIIIIIIIIIKG